MLIHVVLSLRLRVRGRSIQTLYVFPVCTEALPFQRRMVYALELRFRHEPAPREPECLDSP